MENGDVYYRRAVGLFVDGNEFIEYSDAPRNRRYYVGNFWSGTPVPTTESTWGGVKALMQDKDN